MISSSSPVDKRNFLINISEGSLFIAGAAFISSQTVLPALVTRLGGGNVAVGSIAVILWVGLFLPQIFAARYVETLPWKKPWAIWVGGTQRVCVLGLGLSVFLFGGSNPSLALAGVLICFAVSQIGLGVTTPGWFDMFAKLTPPEMRGRLVGIRNSIGGAAAFVCGLVLTWLLTTFSFPLNYSLAFFAAFTLQFLSVIVQSNLVEDHPSRVVERRPMMAYLRQIPDVFRHNIRFRWFMIASAFLVVATMPMGFFTVYALREFGGEESMVGTFTLAMVAIQVASGFANGYIADHYGHRTALIIAASGMCAASVWAILAPTSAWFILVFIFLGINLGSELMIRYNMSIEYGPAERRSTYIGLMNTVLAPFYGTSIIAGWISDQFGYHVMFVCGALASLMGIGILLLCVEDPHRRPVHKPASLDDNYHTVQLHTET